jgi:hypothetical protein
MQRGFSTEEFTMIAGRSPESIEKQLAIHRRNLDHLSEQRAKYGELAAPLSLVNEIHEQEAAIEHLTALLEQDEAASQEVPPPRSYLPVRAYDHFTGRTEELERVMQALREAEKHRLIALYGLGGIGKTALAREAADLSLQEGRFQQVVWISAKTEKFEGVGVEKIPVSDLTFDRLLDDVARQCHLPDLVKQSPGERVQSIQGLLAARPVMIVLDNVETVRDYESLVSQVDELLRGQSKLLLTSRHEVKHTDVHALRLGGLSQDESVTFLQEEGRSRGVTAVAEAPRETLSEVHKATGGAPLAMKLVVGQLSRQPLEPVLKGLQAASFEGQDYEFYRFVFKHSWDMLPLEAKKVLVSMSVFDPAAGGPVQMVLQVSKVDEDAFYPAMDELVTMSLVDFGGEMGQRRYVLHQLTYYFILSDIVKMWG